MYSEHVPRLHLTHPHHIPLIIWGLMFFTTFWHSNLDIGDVALIVKTSSYGSYEELAA